MKPSKRTFAPGAQPAATRLTYAEAIDRGAVLLGAGKLAEAEQICRTILQAKPDDFNAVLLLGIVRSHRNQLDAALACFEQALSSQPASYDALFNRALTLQRLQRQEEALQSYERVLAIKPDCIESLNNRGNALQQLGRPIEAIASYDRALALAPQYADALNNRGNTLKKLRRYGEALECFDRALAAQPAHPQLLNHRAVVLHAVRRYGDALADYDRAVSINPAYVEALSNRGVTLHALQRYAEALKSYDDALAIEPSYADAVWNKSLLLLALGELFEGWLLYEWRTRRSDAPAARSFSKPLWEGEDVRGKRLLLHAEQGLGDAIQFSRYATIAAARGATVILEVPQALNALVSGIDGVSVVVSTGNALPEYDLHCPLMRMPLVLGTTLATIPAATPYINVDAQTLARWSAKLGPRTRMRVGLVWTGNPLHHNDSNRSIPFDLLAPLLDLPVDWICLHKDLSAEERDALTKRPAVRYFANDIADFADTATLTQLCDMVISVDTAVAHLAGALGKPLWLLLPSFPDWRWLVERDDSPWYPSARLFRQPALGDWASVIEHVKRQMQALLGNVPAAAN